MHESPLPVAVPHEADFVQLGPVGFADLAALEVSSLAGHPPT